MRLQVSEIDKVLLERNLVLRVENEHIGAQEPETIGEHAKEYAYWKLEYKNSRIALIAALRTLQPKRAHPQNKEI